MRFDDQRAEEVVGEVERVVSDAAKRASTFLIRLGARAKEEAEDIWAEAKSMSERRS